MPDTAPDERPPEPETPRPPRWARIVSFAATFVGAALGFVFLSSMFPSVSVVVVAATVAIADAARPLARTGPPGRRALGAAGWLVTGAATLLLGYLAVAWGSRLFWTLPLWASVLVGLTAGASAASLERPRRGVRISPLLPLGLWVALCLLGWRLEEGRVRCDDLAALRAQGARLLHPTDPALTRCSPGEDVPIGRYPRGIWEAPDAGRLVVTTQRALAGATDDGGAFDGSVCELVEGQAPRCVGDGKAQGLADVPSLDRLFVASWGRFEGGARGQLLSLTRRAPMELVEAVDVPGSLAELFADPRADRIYGFTDEGFTLVPFAASTLEPLPVRPIPLFVPGVVRYDVERGEGVLCTAGGPSVATLDGERYLSVAVRGDPLELRPLGSGSGVTPLVMTWGCDWDPVARRAYVAAPNLGLVITVDYDSGEVLDQHFVAFGVRSVTVDAPRERLYVTDFLGGAVIAIDRRTGARLGTWRPGRFPRATTLRRDGGALLVGTNLGVVSLPLGAAR